MRRHRPIPPLKPSDLADDLVFEPAGRLQGGRVARDRVVHGRTLKTKNRRTRRVHLVEVPFQFQKHPQRELCLVLSSPLGDRMAAVALVNWPEAVC